MVWSLYFQTLLWITPMFCPLFTWVCPPILYILFYYTAFVIRNLYYKSSEGAHSSDGDTTYLIFVFTNLVFLGAINTSYGYYLLEAITHTCGAFASSPVTPETIIDIIYSRTTIIST